MSARGVTVVGAGLAGCEAAWQLGKRGVPVTLLEMKPGKKSPAHTSESFAELVCSNSFRGDELSTAAGLLKAELRELDSLILRCADENKIAAGGALAVDREEFARAVTQRLRECANVKVVETEALEIPGGEVIIATGPLTSEGFARSVERFIRSRAGGSGADFLHFYDAAAPIVTAESIDRTCSYYGSRYGKGSADYINCPMTREEYLAFYNELKSAKEAPVRGFEDDGVFEGCLPVEVLSRRGEDALRYGPMKPVGLRDPETGGESYAVVQLRRDNAAGTLYNIVGFQTHLTFSEQRRVFSMIPALRDAEFVRYGVMHRNTFIQSPKLLDGYYRLKAEPRVCFAGQITGVEGYVESCASGCLAGMELAQRLLGLPPFDFPGTTAIGSLAGYVSNGSVTNFQPMNINFGIIEPLGYKVRGKRDKNLAISERGLDALRQALCKEREKE